MDKVMIVENEALVLLDAVIMLEKLGYGVHSECTTLPEALNALDEGTPDVALLDINVGRDHVWPLARELKKANCPIIFVSADLTHPELDAEFADCAKLEKPVSQRRFDETLAEVLARSKQGETAASAYA